VKSKLRAGIGYDVHPLVAGRRLVLGGVEIPFGKGLYGWSDADALIHAVIDAMLGAAALGDIGSHYPPGQAEYHGISSLVLLEKTRETLARHGWQVSNVDATIVAEAPHFREYVDTMRERLSGVLKLPQDAVNVKASTNSRLGFVGRGEGIAAFATVMLENLA
jgi:2-C-methyl-D-erythritol 2,4-cyclodiphosphate synthase